FVIVIAAAIRVLGLERLKPGDVEHAGQIRLERPKRFLDEPAKRTGEPVRKRRLERRFCGLRELVAEKTARHAADRLFSRETGGIAQQRRERILDELRIEERRTG